MRERDEEMTWRVRGVCQSVDPEVFFPAPSEPADAALALCRTCDVRTQCLAWAMLHGAEGYWGGTTTYQRKQLIRVRTRAKCPLCQSTSLVYTDPHELCLACGISWIRDVREDPIAATPLPQTAA